VGWFVFGIEIQDNISTYYYTPLRDVIVGAMCAIGIFLFCYRGYDWIESWIEKPSSESLINAAKGYLLSDDTASSCCASRS